MAKLSGPLPNYTFLFLSFLLLVYSGRQMVEAQLCERRSRSWATNFCPGNLLCNQQCRNVEGALSGACLREVLGFACYCYARC